MTEQIKIHSWWKNQLRIHLEGKHLSKWERLAAIPEAQVWMKHYSQTKDGKAVARYLTAVEILILESELDQAKKILGIRKVEIHENPELKTEIMPKSLKLKTSKLNQRGGEMERKRGRKPGRKKAIVLSGRDAKGRASNKGLDVCLLFTVAISINDVKVLSGADGQGKKGKRLKRTPIHPSA